MNFNKQGFRSITMVYNLLVIDLKEQILGLKEQLLNQILRTQFIFSIVFRS